MASPFSPGFLVGTIEGFYGPPWTSAERLELFEGMACWGLNTYLYAPKDDLKHRSLWREPYAAPEAATLQATLQACRQHDLRFVYGLSPGLDIRYSQASELERLQARFEQMITLGCQDFALLFDDLPDTTVAEDLRPWGSLAAAQCHVTNTLFRWTRERAPNGRFLFCPTPYCGRMARQRHGGEGYLDTIGRTLLPDIDVFWTGPEIVSREISLPHIREVGNLLRRQPLLWDNLYANDYDGRRFYVGPYVGRSPELRTEVAGLLVNPNNEFPLNYVPLRTVAAFVRAEESWNPRESYLRAMQEWHARFTTIGDPITLADLILLGDCYYLPHEEGPEAIKLYEAARRLLTQTSQNPKDDEAYFHSCSTQLLQTCTRLAELQDRPLFHALSRRAWELREELELLSGYLRWSREHGTLGAPCPSDFHLPGTYRGGFVPRLQRLLVQHPDGTFTPFRSGASSSPP